jgi:ABC-type sugar transport system ATPase subunit
MKEKPLLQVCNITKSFPGTLVLVGVSMDLHRGEIHGLCGENGAGKSTLIKILSGALKPDQGTIEFDGQNIQGWTTNQALSEGIVTIYQELNLIPELSVAENIHLGFWPTSKMRGVVDHKRMIDSTRNILNKLDIHINPAVQVKDLGIATRQMVEIARAWLIKPKLVILDEPTSSLSPDDAEHLHKMIYQLKNEGVGIIYVSHRLEDVMSVCDRVTALRDGVATGTLLKEDFTREKIVQLMIGRSIRSYGTGGHASDEVVLKVDNLSVLKKIKNLSFELKKGEILGIAGLMGSGRSTMAHSLFGAITKVSGDTYMNNKKIRIHSTSDAIKHKIGLLPEDRRHQALFLDLPIVANMSAANLPRISNYGVINKAEAKIATDLFNKVRVKAPSIESIVSTLSGGNQQKVIISRWLATQCDVLIFDEPTRGIDVGSKEEIYHLIDDFVKYGGAAIVISSEMPELIALSDRILVMANGRITAEFNREEVTEDKLMNKMID